MKIEQRENLGKSLRNPWLHRIFFSCWMKVHLNSISLVNALLIRHLNILVNSLAPDSNTCWSRAIEEYKKVIKSRLILKYSEIVLHLKKLQIFTLMPLVGISAEKSAVKRRKIPRWMEIVIQFLLNSNLFRYFHLAAHVQIKSLNKRSIWAYCWDWASIHNAAEERGKCNSMIFQLKGNFVVWFSANGEKKMKQMTVLNRYWAANTAAILLNQLHT